MSQITLKSSTIFCRDNLEVIRGINSDSIDLIYLDLPFNKGKQFHAPVGSEAEGATFDDIWHEESVKEEWHEEIKARQPELYKYLDAVGDIGSRTAKYYLIYMAVRLFEMHRVLKDTGSLYLHCDPTASHYLKLLLDTIFGHQHFKNEIVWSYRRWPAKQRSFQRMHDILLRYTNSNIFFWNQLFEPLADSTLKADGGLKILNVFDEKGKRMRGKKSGEQSLGSHIRDVWDIGILSPTAKERTGYPTQKPLALLERIIQASCPPEGLVLDPFCGCATTCIAAERLGRKWIGIDVAPKAFELVKARLKKEVPKDLLRDKPIYRTDIPTRTDKDFKKKSTKEDKFFLFGKQDGKCNGCKEKFGIRHFDTDHIVPEIHGGGSEIENLQLLCSNCNRIKGKRTMEYLMARLKELK